MHKDLKAEHCIRKHGVILTVDNISAYDKITIPSSAGLENGTVAILQSITYGFNASHRQGSTFMCEGRQF